MSKIFKGHNCSKRASKPNLTLRIDKRVVLAEPEELIYLSLLDVHPDCDPACYSWKLRTGGGYLPDPYGPTIIYTAPTDNKMCENGAVLDAYAGDKLLDSSYISISLHLTGYWEGKWPWRFIKVTQIYSIVTDEIHAGQHSGNTVQKPDGTWVPTTEYLEAAYIRRFYDCQDRMIGSDHAPRLHYWGTSAPVEMLKEKYGGQVGRVFDYRTEQMKKGQCCPPRLHRMKHEEE